MYFHFIVSMIIVVPVILIILLWTVVSRKGSSADYFGFHCGLFYIIVCTVHAAALLKPEYDEFGDVFAFAF